MQLLDCWGARYFACCSGGLGSSERQNTTDDYFLAGAIWLVVVGASIFASNIGSEHLVGLAGSGATSGVALAHYELHAWCLLVLGWVLAPFYMRSMVYTMPEFLERRFSPASRWVLSLISLVAYVITKIAVASSPVASCSGPCCRNPAEYRRDGADSFWIGSSRWCSCRPLQPSSAACARSPTRSAADADPVIGSLVLTAYGLNALGGWAGSARCSARNVQPVETHHPAGMEGTWDREGDRRIA